MDLQKGSKAPLLTDNEDKGDEERGHAQVDQIKHWYWGNWIFLALTAALCFAVANLMIGEVANLGFTSIFYFNSGALIVCVAYFAIPKFRGSESGNPFNTNGKFDLHRLVLYIAGAVFGLGIYGAVNTTFYFCLRAGLNIGIAATIWGFTAILSSIMEYNFFGTELQKYHVFGLVHMLLAVMFISLSAGAHETKHEQTQSVVAASFSQEIVTTTLNSINQDKKLPIFMPIILSFSMPLVCSSFAMFQKYVFQVKKVPVNDYTFGYILIRQLIVFIVSIFYFSANPLSWRLYIIGAIGSILDVAGSIFANHAIASRAPVGPIFALTDTQILLVTIVAAIRMMEIPHWMQLMGLVSGVVGACILTQVWKAKDVKPE